MLWAIQSHVSSQPPRVLQRACEEIGFAHVFRAWSDDDLPDIPNDKPVLFYGSCAFIDTIKKSGRWFPGAFFSNDEFNFRRYVQKLGSELLNCDCRFLRLRDAAKAFPEAKQVFVRSESDLKELTGATWKAPQLNAYIENLAAAGMTERLELPVVVAERKLIEAEWRLFLVGKVVSSGSQYRSFGDLCCDARVPKVVIDYAEEIARNWVPAPVSVIDVGKIDGKLKVIEFNGFNSTGFYSANVNKIISDVAVWCRENLG